jgi:hypothetical protein
VPGANLRGGKEEKAPQRTAIAAIASGPAETQPQTHPQLAIGIIVAKLATTYLAASGVTAAGAAA